MRTKGIQSIGSVYGEMLNSVDTVEITESTGVKEGGNTFADDNPAPLSDGGPKKEGGYNDPLEDSVADHYGFSKDEDEEGCAKKYNDLDECHECGQPDEQCKCDHDEDEEDEDDDKPWYEKLKGGKKKDSDDSDDEEDEEDEDVEEEDAEEDDDEETFGESSEEAGKIAKRALNRTMSKQLSFDKLYNQIISENSERRRSG